MRLSRVAFVVALASLASAATVAKADTLTLVNNYTEYPGYLATDATDSGAGYLTSDYASLGGGTNTYLTYAISGGPVDTVSLYDRTTSGGGNNAFAGGLYDYTTEFSLTFFDSGNSFTPVTYTFNKPIPTSTSSVSDFFYTASFAPVSAEFVTYQVVAAQGSNPGLADFELTGSSVTPEPGSLALLGTGVLGLAGLVRRRISAK